MPDRVGLVVLAVARTADTLPEFVDPAGRPDDLIGPRLREVGVYRSKKFVRQDHVYLWLSGWLAGCLAGRPRYNGRLAGWLASACLENVPRMLCRRGAWKA